MLGEHQRQQPEHLWLVGHQLGELAPEPDRLVGEIDANRGRRPGRQVRLVEDEVDHAQHPRQPVGQLGSRRHPVWQAGGLDLGLGAHEALRHGRDRRAEGGRDLVGRQPGDAAQRERDPAVGVEHRVAAREDQAQAVVVDTRRPALLAVLHLVDLMAALERVGVTLAARPRRLSGETVEGAAARDRVHPPGRVGGPTVDRPAFRSQQPRVLQAVLGEREVAERADQRGEGRWPECSRTAPSKRARSSLPVRRQRSTAAGISSTGRTSTVPVLAPGILAASSCARSSVATLTM